MRWMYDNVKGDDVHHIMELCVMCGCMVVIVSDDSVRVHDWMLVAKYGNFNDKLF